MIQRGIATFGLDYGKCPKWLFEKKFSIPKEPRIPLENYLLDLVSKSDGKQSSIYLLRTEEFIKKIWKEMNNQRGKTLNVRKSIPQYLGIHSMMLYNYKNGKKGVPIQILYKLLLFWKLFCNKNEKDVSKKWEEIYQSNYILSGSRRQLVSLPKYISPQLSYFAGWICGDGNLSNCGNHYLIKISEKSTSQLKNILQPLCKELFNTDFKIYRIYQGGYALQIGSKPLFRFLTQVLQLQVGKIPPFISGLEDVYKRYFLAGIFDSEGYVCKKRYLLTISQAKLDFIITIKNLFNEIGVKFNGPTQHRSVLGQWYTIRLEKKSEILKFAEFVGSYHVDKSKVLQNMLLKIKEKQ